MQALFRKKGIVLASLAIVLLLSISGFHYHRQENFKSVSDTCQICLVCAATQSLSPAKQAEIPFSHQFLVLHAPWKTLLPPAHDHFFFIARAPPVPG